MLISVIVPSLTGEVPLSLLRQTNGRDDVEVIVVKGVSPDARARNEGLKRATGEWIVWVDADDEVCEDWLEEIECSIKVNGEEGADAIVFDAYNDGCPCVRGDYVYGKPRAEVHEVVKDIYEDKVLFSHLWRTVTRRGLWTGHRFDETIRCSLADFQLLPLVLMHAKRIRYLPRKLYRYVFRTGNLSTTISPASLDSGIRVAIQRWHEAPPEYRKAAACGSVRQIYFFMYLPMVDPEWRKMRHEVPGTREGSRFLLRHCLSVRCGLRERIRLICAGMNFWVPQRLAFWWHRVFMVGVFSLAALILLCNVHGYFFHPVAVVTSTANCQNGAGILP